jgi:hypothetical protein
MIPNLDKRQARERSSYEPRDFAVPRARMHKVTGRQISPCFFWSHPSRLSYRESFQARVVEQIAAEIPGFKPI